MSDFESIRKNWSEILQNMTEDHDILPLSFDTWFKPLKLYDLINNELIIIVPEEGFIGYLNKKYSLLLKIAIEEKTGIPVDIHFLIENDAREYVKKLQGSLNEKRDPNIILEEPLKEAGL